MSKSTNRIIIATLMVAIVLLTVCFPLLSMPGVAHAVDNYSAVLDDLRSADNFDESKFPESRTDYSVNIIQVAEGEHGNLFIYTYQPCTFIKSLTASKINMSLTEKVDGTKLYDLKLVSSDGVFSKYEVAGYTVPKTAPIRYYNISTIYRAWIPGVDKKADADKNVINAVAFPAGQLWTAKGFGENVKYDMHEIEVVTITSQMIGFRRYADGFQMDATKYTDSHFMAFNCDHDIDFLLSADIEFVTTPYKQLEGQAREYGTSTPQHVTLENYQVGSNDGSGWFIKEDSKKQWHRMTRVSDYISEVELDVRDDDDKKLIDSLSNYDWILNFYETDYERSVGGKDILITMLVPFGFIGLIVDSCTTKGTLVSEVTLLRLEFSYDGEIYDLGVVADSQSGDINPVGSIAGKFDIKKWFKDTFGNLEKILKIAGIVVAVLIVLVLVVLVVSSVRGRGTKVKIVQGSGRAKKSRK